jgi:putative hydrolase of the HAD superfamily
VTTAAVFFDAGETLVHPHPSFPELFAQVLRSEGHDVPPEVVRDRVHVVSDRFAEAARDEELWTTSPEKSRAFWLSVYEIFLDDLGVPGTGGLHDLLYAEFTDLSNYSLFDDVLPVLERLRDEGMTLGVVSNFEEWLERLLDMLGISRFFDVRVISGIEGMEKPDPRIFRLALERAGVPAEDSVYVGDNPVFDVDPAREIGMVPVLIDRRERFPGFSTARITTMSQLPAAIGLDADGPPRTTTAPGGRPA